MNQYYLLLLVSLPSLANFLLFFNKSFGEVDCRQGLLELWRMCHLTSWPLQKFLLELLTPECVFENIVGRWKLNQHFFCWQRIFLNSEKLDRTISSSLGCSSLDAHLMYVSAGQRTVYHDHCRYTFCNHTAILNSWACQSFHRCWSIEQLKHIQWQLTELKIWFRWSVNFLMLE